MSSFNPLTGSLVEPEDDFIRLMESCLQSPTAASRQFSSLFSPSDAFNGSGGLSRYGSLNSNGSHHHNGLNGHVDVYTSLGSPDFTHHLNACGLNNGSAALLHSPPPALLPLSPRPNWQPRPGAPLLYPSFPAQQRPPAAAVRPSSNGGMFAAPNPLHFLPPYSGLNRQQLAPPQPPQIQQQQVVLPGSVAQQQQQHNNMLSAHAALLAAPVTPKQEQALAPAQLMPPPPPQLEQRAKPQQQEQQRRRRRAGPQRSQPSALFLSAIKLVAPPNGPLPWTPPVVVQARPALPLLQLPVRGSQQQDEDRSPEQQLLMAAVRKAAGNAAAAAAATGAGAAAAGTGVPRASLSTPVAPHAPPAAAAAGADAPASAARRGAPAGAGRSITGAPPADSSSSWPVGRLVWAKVAKFPWWPAVVVDPATVGEADAHSVHEQQPGAAAAGGSASSGSSVSEPICVRFLGTHDTAWLADTKVSGWGGSHQGERSSRTKAAAFVGALRDARAYAAQGDLPAVFGIAKPAAKQEQETHALRGSTGGGGSSSSQGAPQAPADTAAASSAAAAGPPAAAAAPATLPTKAGGTSRHARKPASAAVPPAMPTRLSSRAAAGKRAAPAAGADAAGSGRAAKRPRVG